GADSRRAAAAARRRARGTAGPPRAPRRRGRRDRRRPAPQRARGLPRRSRRRAGRVRGPDLRRPPRRQRATRMRTVPLAVATLAALASPLAAQVNQLQWRRLVVLHGPSTIDFDSLQSVCAGPDSVACVHKGLGAVFDGEPMIQVVQTDRQEHQPRSGELSFYIHVSAQVKDQVPDARADEILTALVHDLEPRLDVLMRQHPLQSGQRQLQELSDRAGILEAQYLELRKRAAVMLRADLQTAAAIAADLDKQRLNVEL